MKLFVANCVQVLSLTVFSVPLVGAGAPPPAHDLEPYGRAAFERGEADGRMTLVYRNRSAQEVKDAKLVVEQLGTDGSVVRSETIRLADVRKGDERRLSTKMETRLRPGYRKLRVRFVCKNGQGEAFDVPHEFAYGIGPQVLPTMPVIMDGYGHEQTNATHAEIVRDMVDFGYTIGGYHFARCIYYSEERDRLPQEGTRFWKAETKKHDEALMGGARLIHSVRMQWTTNFLGMADEQFARHDRTGKNLSAVRKFKSMEMGHPAEVAYLRELSRRKGVLFGTHPGSAGVIPMSEMRDFAQVSWGGWDEHLYRYLTGRKGYPDLIAGKSLDPAVAAKRYPTGIVPDGDEILEFFRWYWTVGDGWNAAARACADGYRDGLGSRKPDYIVLWEPAVRVPPTWGSGANSTHIAQWCYANPEPLNIAGPCEETLAMAKGQPGQKAVIANQLIMYRIYVAPEETEPETLPEWAVRLPKARFPGIPPDVLDESTWAMIAKPVDALKFHGWGCIKDTGNTDMYVCTNPETGKAHRRMLRDVVAPLGPTLLKLGRTDPDVAVLESFASSVLGQTGTTDNGWDAPSITYLQRARLDPKVVYENDVLKDGGLDGIKLLYLVRCKYLTETVIARLRDFQANGGLLMADDDLPKCLKADVHADKISFDPPPALDDEESVAEVSKTDGRKRGASEKAKRMTRAAKDKMVRQAGDLRKALAGRYVPKSDSSSADIVVFNRQWKDVPYLFAISDKRDFGDYVGPWGQLMEKGLPNEGWVSLRDPEKRVGAVYELSKGGEVSFTREGEDVKVPLAFTTSDGRFLAFLPEKIGSVEATASASVTRGGTIDVTFKVLGVSGKVLPALLPVEIRVRDAAGKELDGTGFLAAEDGVAHLTVLTNLDDAPGDYTVTCRDRASGLVKELTVKGR